jgi:hypothetical protein
MTLRSIYIMRAVATVVFLASGVITLALPTAPGYDREHKVMLVILTWLCGAAAAVSPELFEGLLGRLWRRDQNRAKADTT